MILAVGTENNRKMLSIKKALKEFVDENEFELVPVKVSSKVSETPWNEETIIGAKNRALGAIENSSKKADYSIGIESGLVVRYGNIFEEVWVCIIDQKAQEIYAYSSGLKIPDYILGKMDKMKLEHYKVMGIIEKEYGLEDSDTWGTYTGQKILREVSLEESLRNAFVQIFSGEGSFYKK